MNAASPPFGLPDTAPALARRLGMILAGLAALVARDFLRRPHLVGLTVRLWSRLSRAVWRFSRLMTRPKRVRAPRTRQARDEAARTRPPGLPSGRGWLVRELGYEAAGYGCQLAALLADPAMQAALATVPGVARMLRPLCRMLGVAPEPAIPAVVAPAEPASRVGLLAEAGGLPAWVGDCAVSFAGG